MLVGGLVINTSLNAMNLHDAIKKGSFSDVEKIITTTPNIDINQKNKNGQTPLHLAFHQYDSDSEMIELLLKYGADPNIPNNDKETPLLWAARRVMPLVILLLFQYGANPSLANIHGKTPFTEIQSHGGPGGMSWFEIIMGMTLKLDLFYKKLIMLDDETYMIEFKEDYDSTGKWFCNCSIVKKLYYTEPVNKNVDKKSFCSEFVDKPGIIIKCIEQDWYDETIIKECYQWHINGYDFKDKPVVCDKVLNALWKKERDKRYMNNILHANAYFAFN